jgi:cytochrome c oxidase subunit II
VHLHSKDVIHSFFLPNFRVKQDAVPGLGVTISFTPDKVGEYEIACAELCGALHFNMKGKLVVDPSEDEFKAWQKTLLAQ